MLVPPGMSERAVTFCSIQPCTRHAEGDLIIERNGQEERVAVCPRHAEYLFSHFGGEDIDPQILSKEIVFVDDVGRDSMIDDIIERGDPHDIIGE